MQEIIWGLIGALWAANSLPPTPPVSPYMMGVRISLALVFVLDKMALYTSADTTHCRLLPGQQLPKAGARRTCRTAEPAEPQNPLLFGSQLSQFGCKSCLMAVTRLAWVKAGYQEKMTVSWTWWVSRGEAWERSFQKGVQHGIAEGSSILGEMASIWGGCRVESGWGWSWRGSWKQWTPLTFLSVLSPFLLRTAPSPIHSRWLEVRGNCQAPHSEHATTLGIAIGEEWSHDPCVPKRVLCGVGEGTHKELWEEFFFYLSSWAKRT